MKEIDALARNLVAAGQWLPFEVYLAWTLAKAQEGDEPPPSSRRPAVRADTPTVGSRNR